MRRLLCAFVVRIRQKQVFSRRGSNCHCIVRGRGCSWMCKFLCQDVLLGQLTALFETARYDLDMTAIMSDLDIANPLNKRIVWYMQQNVKDGKEEKAYSFFENACSFISQLNKDQIANQSYRQRNISVAKLLLFWSVNYKSNFWYDENASWEYNQRRCDSMEKAAKHQEFMRHRKLRTSMTYCH